MAKGKGEIKGWITRNGVHVPIYDHYTVREGHEPGEHGVKGKFKPKSRTEQMRSNIERDLHSKLMTYWRGDERFVKSSLRDSMEKVDTMLEYFKENKKNFIEPSADYPRDIVWRFSGKDKHTGKHAGFEFDSYPRESDARETLRGNGYTVNNGIIFPKPIFQYLMDKTNVEDTDIDVAKAVMKQALKEYKSDKGITRGGKSKSSKSSGITFGKDVDAKVAGKFSVSTQPKISFAEKDSYGKYHVVVNSEKFGEASFHDTNFSNMKWEIQEFLKNGTRY